jgi:hypothetical protein
MMSCLEVDLRAKYVGVQNCVFILKRIFQAIQAEYTLKLLKPSDRYATGVLRSKLMRDVAVIFKESYEELVMATDDLIPIRENSTW